ncbi:MAG: hypothetical protein B7X55_03145 [Rhodobacterales bacterium 34-62-10]|nr:MAG: hypothetical protein B7X55_03145 [Rhodobacterales bacterium 34-62-10]
MKPHFHLLLGAVVATLPLTAAAQEMSGIATFGLGNLNGPSGFPDVSVRSLDGKLDLSYDNGLMLGASAASARADVDGFAEDASANVFGLTAGANFASFWNGGVYYEFGDVSIDGIGNESIDSYGVFMGYDSDLMAFEVFAGTTDGYVLSGTGVDWNDLGASASFNIGAEGTVGGHIQRSRLSAAGVDVDLTSLGLGGSYAFGNGLVGYAGITYGEVDDLIGDLTTYGLGLGYDLSTTANFPATLSLEVARSTLDDGTTSADLDSIRFGITLPVGGTKSAPLNSVASNAMSPNRTALSTALVGSF